MVNEAATAAEALTLLASGGATVDALVADVGLPDGRGTELAASASTIRPGLPVLFVSGFAPELGTDEDVELLEKPFTSEQLLERVQQVLDRPVDLRETLAARLA